MRKLFILKSIEIIVGVFILYLTFKDICNIFDIAKYIAYFIICIILTYERSIIASILKFKYKPTKYYILLIGSILLFLVPLIFFPNRELYIKFGQAISISVFGIYFIIVLTLNSRKGIDSMIRNYFIEKIVGNRIVKKKA